MIAFNFVLDCNCIWHAVTISIVFRILGKNSTLLRSDASFLLAQMSVILSFLEIQSYFCFTKTLAYSPWTRIGVAVRRAKCQSIFSPWEHRIFKCIRRWIQRTHWASRSCWWTGRICSSPVHRLLCLRCMGSQLPRGPTEPLLHNWKMERHIFTVNWIMHRDFKLYAAQFAKVWQKWTC